MNLRQANIPLIWQWGLWIAVAAFLGGLLGLAVNPAYAAGSIASSVTAVKLYRGTSIVLSSDPNSATYRADFTADACRIEKQVRGQAEADAKLTGNPYTAQWKCQVEERDSWSYVATPTCPPPRAAETRQTVCPNDPARTFTQTQTWTIAPHPTCEAPTGWTPATPSTTDCPAPPPPQLPAPSGVTATAVSTSEIRVSWNVVPDALAYSLRRCIGTSCDPMGFPALRCVQGLTQPHVTLGPGVSVRYQVQASRTADCSDLGPPSTPIVGAVTLVSGTNPPTPPNPNAPVACVGRLCTVNWSPGAPVAEAPVAGFRVVWGPSATQLVGSADFNNAGLRSGQVTVTQTGLTYFGVKAFTASGVESFVSDLVSRTVQ